MVIEPESFEQITYKLIFQYTEELGLGFAFDCDEHGNVLPFKNEFAKFNYLDCMAGKDNIKNMGVVKMSSIFISCSAFSVYKCRQLIELTEQINICSKCGARYGFYGHSLIDLSSCQPASLQFNLHA